jgi:hypothetical protein
VTWAQWFSFYVEIPAAWYAAALFIAVYTALAPWWRNPLGRTMVALDGAIVLTLGPHMLRLWFGLNEASAAYAWFELGAFLIVPLAILWRVWVLVRIHRGRSLFPWLRNPAAAVPDPDSAAAERLA